MADFFTRVELQGGTATDYTKLHAEMEKHGFYGNVRGHDGRTIYTLPTGIYHRASIGTAIAVRDAARLAAQATGLKSIVLTVEAASWAGHFEPR